MQQIIMFVITRLLLLTYEPQSHSTCPKVVDNDRLCVPTDSGAMQRYGSCGSYGSCGNKRSIWSMGSSGRYCPTYGYYMSYLQLADSKLAYRVLGSPQGGGGSVIPYYKSSQFQMGCNPIIPISPHNSIIIKKFKSYLLVYRYTCTVLPQIILSLNPAWLSLIPVSTELQLATEINLMLFFGRYSVKEPNVVSLD